MHRAVLSLLTLAVCLQASGPIADVLQRGIYTQDTLGDLDGAIAIYREVIAAPAGTRTYVAQAWYRLGVCLRSKGDRAGAADAWQTLIRDYSDQQELVDRARAGMPGKDGLLPPPWSPDEIAEYRGDDGTPRLIWAMTRVTRAKDESRFDIRFHWPPMGVVDVHRLTLQHGRPGPFPSVAGTPSVEFIENELWYGLRRLPMTPGETRIISVRPRDTQPYVVRVPGETRIVSQRPRETQPYAVSVKAVSIDEVQVPAGRFRTLRLDLSPGGARFWIATGGSRPLVKFEAPGIRGELTRLSNGPAPARYRDPLVGYELSIPTGWFVHSRPPSNGGPGMCVDLIDLETDGALGFCAKRQDTPAQRIDTDLRKGADQRAADQRQRWPDFRVREPFEIRSSHGYKTLMLISDYTVNGARRVEFLGWAQSESARASISGSSAADQFERFRARFLPVFDSLRIP